MTETPLQVCGNGDQRLPSLRQIFTIWREVAGQAAWLAAVIRLCRTVFPPGARAGWTPAHRHFPSPSLLAVCSPGTYKVLQEKPCSERSRGKENKKANPTGEHKLQPF